MINSGFRSKDELLEELPGYAEAVFGLDDIEQQVRVELGSILTLMRDDVVCYFEYPYVEKYYRDSYYAFFSRKLKDYDRNCIRISFFTPGLNDENFYKEKAEEKFLGYVTVRPTTYRIIGYSFLNPKALKSCDNFVCCLSTRTVVVKGRKLSICAFPYSSQDGEFVACAETTVLNLADYFAVKYSDYATILPSRIHELLSDQSPERQLPTRGLTISRISYVLKKLGFGPLLYSVEDKGIEKFKELLFTYVESGIPVIALITDKKNPHVVQVIGRPSIKYSLEPLEKLHDKLKNHKKHDFSTYFDKILVMNDNRVPYELVNFDKPAGYSDENSQYKFVSFVAPLYPKVHMEAESFRNAFFEIVRMFEVEYNQTKDMDFTGKNHYIFRSCLTSSKSYKNYIASANNLVDDYKNLIVNSEMPKFVWVGEVFEGKDLLPGHILKSTIVVDATESGRRVNWIFATDFKKIVFNEIEERTGEDFDTEHVTARTDGGTLTLYTNGLSTNHLI